MDPGAALEHVLARALDGPPLRDDARIALHFHPDTDLRGEPTLERILRDGSYLSQFVTGTSNGGLTAEGRGDRWRWEQRMFGGTYDDAPAGSRPVYGALVLDRDPYGPSPRFGSAWFRLRRATVDRATFAFPDSAQGPEAFGVARRMGLVELLRASAPGDPLDRYVESHVHGGVAVPGDVEALVRHALSLEGASDAWEITVVLVDDDELSQLHEQFMGLADPTDIMTFPAGDDEEREAGGDLVISVERAAQQGPEHGLSGVEEVAFLVVHGLLHLCGWNDDSDDDRRLMLERQHVILDSFSFRDRKPSRGRNAG